MEFKILFYFKKNTYAKISMKQLRNALKLAKIKQILNNSN